MTKPTARQVWRQLVDEAGDDELAAILSLTQEQVDAELAGIPGFDAKTEQAAAEHVDPALRASAETRARRWLSVLEDLASGALEGSTAVPQKPPTSAVVAIAQPQAASVLTQRRRRPRTAMVLLFAAIAAAAAGAAYVTLRPGEPSPRPPSPQPSPEPSPAPSFDPQPDLVAAADWRKKAIGACDTQKWEECLADLDIARAIDPDGDETPLVKATRDRAIKGILAKPPKPDKPPVP
ncbi:MAG TPA: hypothetical protein VMI75_29240 [Polyangiaceae bacterium]|nr:hypothetical protein [Polyangiaceae bacterium]